MIDARDIAAEAIRSLRADPRQSILALLGVVGGVAAIMTALAIGEGARREALAEVDGLGIDNVIVRTVDAAGGRGRAAQPLTLDEARLLTRAVAGAAVVAPSRNIRLPFQADSRTAIVTVLGVTPEWNRVIDATISDGRWLTPAEAADHRRVIVLGSALAARAFDRGAAIGRDVKVGRDWYRVVGVLAPRSDPAAGRSSVSRVDLQEAVIAPLAAVPPRTATAGAIDEIVVRGGDAERITALAQTIRGVLARRLPPEAVEVVVPRELVAARLRTRRAFDAVLMAIGGLVLGISGLGIMNVMLGGVARRTVEIGVRRAVGARSDDILSQFLAEAALLCAAGGVAGVPAGIAMSLLAGGLAGWRTSVSVAAVFLAIGAATAVGLVCGAYPAKIAAALTPCDALRGE